MLNILEYKNLLDECYLFNRKLSAENRPAFAHEDIGFLYDGPVIPESWDEQQPKILFLAMEQYGNWGDPPRFVTDQHTISKLFHRRIAWFTKVLGDFIKSGMQLSPEEAEAIYRNENKLHEGWLNSCYIETKKISSKNPNVNTKEVIRHGMKNLFFLKKQIELLEPDIIFCCGKPIFEFFIRHFGMINPEDYQYKYEKWCYPLCGKKIAINSQHPSWRFFRRLDYYRLITDELRAFTWLQLKKD